MARKITKILKQSKADVLVEISEDQQEQELNQKLVEALASEFGVDPNEDAVIDAFNQNPKGNAKIVKQLQDENPDEWNRDAQVEAWSEQEITVDPVDPNEPRDQLNPDSIIPVAARDHWFNWAWRPALSWIVVFLIPYVFVLVPAIKALLSYYFPEIEFVAPGVDSVVAISGIWLAIYGIGHTAKAIFQKPKV